MKTTRQNCLHRLVHDQRGAIAITFALTFASMLGGTLFAVDMVRYSATQSRLQNSLDAAVISAGRKLADYKPTQGGEPSQAWKDDAYAFFKANMPARYLGSDIPLDTLNIVYSEERVGSSGQYLSGQVVSMTVSGKMPLLSTGFNNLAPMNVYAVNSAIRRVRNDLELVLALDNTGSMGQSSGSTLPGEATRMDILKKSAKGLIDTVMSAAAAGGQTDGVSGAYIGLVPFTDSVNVKNISGAKGWLNKGGNLTHPVNLQNVIDQVWGGCIVEPRPSAIGWTASNPLPALVLSPTAGFMPMISTYSIFYTPVALNSTNGGSANNYLISLNKVESGAGYYNFQPPTIPYLDRRFLSVLVDNGSSATVVPDQKLDWLDKWPVGQTLTSLPRRFQVNLAMETGPCTKSMAMFLSQDGTALNSAVDTMAASGNTNVSTGLLWAWRMLSPVWQGSWDGSQLPRAAASKLRKVVVLLSDGDNQPAPAKSSIAGGNKDIAFTVKYAFASCTSPNDKTGVCNDQSGWSTTSKTDTVKVGTVLEDKSKNPATLSLSSFRQCPLDGLLMVDLTAMTPDSLTPGYYRANCSTTAGSPHSNQTGYSTSGADGLGTAALNTYMAKLCSNVKADTSSDIQIYTLTLGQDVSSTAKNLMSGCATDANHYFDVSNAAELPDVFAQIAGALTELRLTQ
ncbi:TadE/TadG family type IV pilus assembly protein [Castellaniella sp. MT123]|uniref:TadE/TadG family type IV pilus assembly protein n=1 Tax=Castellaniella sp. MT123 TaxID=3140381 RepID=UPI0031F3F5B6